jgi:hypothetical protein
MRNRPFEFNILVVYLKWTKIVEVDENCRFIIKFLKEVNDLWREKFKLFNKGTNCLLSIENKYQNIVLRFIHLWRHIRKPIKWTKTADVALYIYIQFYGNKIHLIYKNKHFATLTEISSNTKDSFKWQPLFTYIFFLCRG